MALKRWAKFLVQTAIVLAALALGGGGAYYLIQSRQTPPKQPVERLGPLVEVTIAERKNVPVTVGGYGTVRAASVVPLVPQVSGKIDKLSPSMVNGGFFGAGEVLIQIERREFELALAQAKADKLQAEATVNAREADIRAAEADLNDAREELKQKQELAQRNSATPREVNRARFAEQRAEARLEMARAQLKQAQATVKQLQSRIDIAQLNLDRTQVSLPFDGRIMQEDLGEGQMIVAGQPVAQAYRTDMVEVIVPFADHQLEAFDVPLGYKPPSRSLADRPEPTGRDEGGNDASEPTARMNGEAPPPPAGPSATIIFGDGRDEHVRTGEVKRTEGSINERTRMVHVVIEVKDPFSLNPGRLVPGKFVRVEISGRTMEDVIPLPRYALHDQKYVWLDRDGALSIQQVEVERVDDAMVYIRSGIHEGDRVIVSAIDKVTDGMKIRSTVRELGSESAAEPVNDGNRDRADAGSKEATTGG